MLVIQHQTQSFWTISDFRADGVAFNSSHLLEEGELRDFGSIDPNFPTYTACSGCLAFPVVFDETKVVLGCINPDGIERTHVKVHDVLGRRLHDDLVLVVALASLWVKGVSTVCRPAGWLDVGDVPGIGTKNFQCGCRVHGACANFGVIGLQKCAPLCRPVVVKPLNEFLKGHWYLYSTYFGSSTFTSSPLGNLTVSPFRIFLPRRLSGSPLIQQSYSLRKSFASAPFEMMSRCLRSCPSVMYSFLRITVRMG